MGSYYTVVYHLDDGTVSRENWVVPVASSPVQLTAVRSTVMPMSVAMQTVSKAYVDRAVAGVSAGATASTLGTVKLAAGQTSTTLATVATTGSASDIGSGTLADARLSPNVPLLDASNIYSGAIQTIQTTAATNVGLQIVNGGTALWFVEAGSAGWLNVAPFQSGLVTFSPGGLVISSFSDPIVLGGYGVPYLTLQNTGATFSRGVSAPTFSPQQLTPATSTAACSAGQMSTDASYIYVCKATNTIKSAALSSF